MSFTLVDQILEFHKAQSIRAVKYTASLKDYFVDSVVHGTVVPSTLVAEAVAQAAGWLITASLDFEKRGLLIGLGNVELNGIISPGQRIVLEAELLSLHEDAAMLTGRARLDDRIVGRVDSGLCLLVDANRLDDVERTRSTFFSLMKERGRAVLR